MVSAAASIDFRAASASEPGCADSRDIIVPPPQNLRQAQFLFSWRNRTQLAGDSADSRDSWDCELYFSGAASRAPLGSLCVPGDSVGAHEHAAANNRSHCYSQGVRQLVWALYSKRPGFCLHATRHDDLLSKSRFCLAPSAEGFGNRLSISVLAGCVPVIIQPTVLQPFHDVLPYARFALVLNFEDIPRLHERLALISPAQHSEMRRQLALHLPAFVWSPPVALPKDAKEHHELPASPAPLSYDQHPHRHRTSAPPAASPLPNGDALSYEYTRYTLCLRAGLECEWLRPASPTPSAARSLSAV